MLLLQRTARQCLCSQSRPGSLLRQAQAVTSEQAREAFFVFPLELGDWVLLGLLCSAQSCPKSQGDPVLKSLLLLEARWGISLPPWHPAQRPPSQHSPCALNVPGWVWGDQERALCGSPGS